MVILHIKRGEKDNNFLTEVLTSLPIEQVSKEVTELHNLRIKVLRTALCMKELAKHGPMRPEETRGITSDVNFQLDVNAYGKPTAPDQYGYRTGCPPAGEVAEVLTRTATEADQACGPHLVGMKKCLTKEVCVDCMDQMRGAVMIAYPAFHRLPTYDPVRMELSDAEELDGRSELQDVLDFSEASLWFAGKEMVAGKIMSEYVGKNEKTKVVIKLQNKASGAPVREPRVDEGTHRAMLSYYYKKQEEQKRLTADEDDSYLDAQWADSKALKRNLINGGRNIGFRGM